MKCSSGAVVALSFSLLVFAACPLPAPADAPQPVRQYARARMLAGDYQTASAVLRQLMQSDPSADNHTLLGQCYFALGNTIQARSEFVEALKLSPDNVSAIIGLVDIAVNEGDLKAAQSLCKQGLTRVHDKNAINRLHKKMLSIQDIIWSKQAGQS